MTRPKLVAMFVGVAAAVTVPPTSLHARSHADQGVFVTVRMAQAGIARGNGVATLSVFVACGGGVALEGLLTLSQDDQATWGQGSMGVLVCDGVEREYGVRVRAISGTFHRGPAHASAYALICSELACATASPTQTVTLRGRPA